MNGYIVRLNEADKIHSSPDELINACNNFISLDYIAFRSYNFIEGTGLMNTVREEIDFVLQSYKANNLCILDFEDFINTWEFSKYIDFKLAELSGGWKKFLSVALFCNQKSDGKIFLDVSRHLSDRLIDLFIKNLANTQCNTSFFFEYDMNNIASFGFKTLWFLPTKELSTDFDHSIIRKGYHETNYESIKYQ